MGDLTTQTVDDAAGAAQVLSRLEEAAWVLAGFIHLVESGALTAEGLTLSTTDDEAAARMLAAVGLIDEADPFQLSPGSFRTPVRRVVGDTPPGDHLDASASCDGGRDRRST